jgi:hypothetical protein
LERVILKIEKFGKEAASLDMRDICDLVKRTADSLRKLPSAKRHANISFALVVKSGYEEIRKLREDGYSFDLICEAFARNGLLSEYAKPNSLRTAFSREKSRREQKDTQKQNAVMDKAKPAVKGNVSLKSPEPQKANADDNTAENERIRKMTGITVNTGLGEVVKHSDGTFDFD